MPPLSANVTKDAASLIAEILVTDRDALQLLTVELPRVVLHPRSPVVGMGCNRDTSERILRAYLEAALASTGLVIHSVAALTSADARAHEGGLVRLAKHLSVPFVCYEATELAGTEVSTPSEVVAS